MPVPLNDIYSDGLRAVEFDPTAWKLIILISYTLKDTQEGSAAMLQGELKILSHPTDLLTDEKSPLLLPAETEAY